MKSRYATISTEQPREGQPATSGTITDEMINEYINEQEGETVEDDRPGSEAFVSRERP